MKYNEVKTALEIVMFSQGEENIGKDGDIFLRQPTMVASRAGVKQRNKGSVIDAWNCKNSTSKVNCSRRSAEDVLVNAKRETIRLGHSRGDNHTCRGELVEGAALKQG